MNQLRKISFLLLIMLLITLAACGDNNNSYNKNKNYNDNYSNNESNNNKSNNNGSSNNGSSNNGSSNNGSSNSGSNNSGSSNNVIKTGISYGFLEESDTVTKATVTFEGSKIEKIITEEYFINLKIFAELKNLDFFGEILGVNKSSYIRIRSLLNYSFYAKYILIDDILFIGEKIDDNDLIYKTETDLTIEDFLNLPENVEKYINAVSNKKICLVESPSNRNKYEVLKNYAGNFLVSNRAYHVNYWKENFDNFKKMKIDILENFDNIDIEGWHDVTNVDFVKFRIASPVEYLKLFKKAYYNAS